MIACFTGAILVFEEELQHSLHHERYYVKEQKEVQLPITVVTATLKQQLPDAKIGGVKIYSEPSRTLEYSIKLPEVKKANAPKDEGKRVTAFVDPYTAQIIEVYTYGDSYFYTIMALHRWLLGDDIGKLIMGTATLLFLFIMITGVILWWPKTKVILKQRVSIMWSAGWKRISRDFHYTLGIYSVLFLFIFAFTALVWSFQWFNDGIYVITKSSKEPIKAPKSEIVDSVSQVSVDAVLSDIYTRVPKAVFYNVSIPTDSTGSFGVNVLQNGAPHANATDNHYYDQYSGEYIKTVTFGERPLGQQVRAAVKPIHTSSIWGLPSKILGFIVCVFGTTFPITGVIMWLSRIKKI
jgi:uncharacterized iron-regulated membrane protein